MTGGGIVVNADAIKAYGSVVSTQEQALAHVHASLAGVYLDANAFGKLPEAGELHTAYTAHAQDVLLLTSELPQQISQVAQGLHSTASTYADLESGIADGIRSLFGTGSAGMTSAGGDIMGGFAQLTSNSMKAYDWANKSEEELPKLVTGFDGASDGIEGLLEAAVNWVIEHVPELPKLLDDVTGDTQALLAAAEVWHNQGTSLNSVISTLRLEAGYLCGEWGGDAAQSFGEFMGDVTSSLATLSKEMGSVQKILEDAAQEADFAHSTIVMIITQVVEWVAGNLLADALTLGLATGVEAAGTAAFLAKKVEDAEQAASKLAKVYKALQEIVKSLEKLKKGYEEAKGLERLKKFGSLAKDFNDGLEAGAVKNLRYFSDGKLAGVAKAVWGGGEHTAEAKEVAKLGLGGVAANIGVKAGFTGVMGATGLSADPGLVAGLGKNLVSGELDQISGNPTGAAETMGLGTPPIPDAPPVNRIDALLRNLDLPEKTDGS